jgi:hypothetical protein
MRRKAQARNDDVIHHSRDANLRRVMPSVTLTRKEGAGNARCLAAPAEALCAIVKKHTSIVIYRRSRNIDIPCAMV